MIINQVKLSNIELTLNNKMLAQTLSYIDNEEVQTQILLQIGHSVDCTQNKVFLGTSEHSEISFQKQIVLLTQKQDSILKVQLKIVSNKKSTIFSKSIQLNQFVKLLMIQLGSQNFQQQIKVSYQCKYEEKKNDKMLKIINPKCQIMRVDVQKQKYFLQMSYLSNSYRTLVQNSNFFWEESFTIAIGNENNTFCVNLVDSKLRKTKIHQLSIQIFKQRVGSKKIMLFNENKCPIGCFQFDYQTYGFSNLQREELIPQQYTSDLYKINIVKIKGKFKEPTSYVSIKIASILSNIDTERITVTDNAFQSEFGKHIYSEQSKCIFIVSCRQNDKDVVGYAPLDLMMLGKFQKSIVINHSLTKKVIGNFFVCIEATKKSAKALNLSSICLKLQRIDQKYKNGQVMLNARMGCCLGKTQIKEINNFVNFVKKLQVKYIGQSTLQIIVAQVVNNTKLEIQITLPEIQQKISGKYQKQFGTQTDFIKGLISFEYNYDQHKKASLDQKKLKEGVNNMKREQIQSKITQIQQKIIGQKNKQPQILNKPLQENLNLDEKKLKQEVLQKKQIQNENIAILQNPPVLLSQTPKQTFQNIQTSSAKKNQKLQAKPVNNQLKKFELIKKTPKQALLQQTLQSYLLQNHIHQYQKPYKRIKSRKKKVMAARINDQAPNLNPQSDFNKRSKGKTTNPSKRYQFVVNAYLGSMLINLQKNTASTHKKSNSSKITHLSLKKQNQYKNQPQLPQIARQNINNDSKKGSILELRVTARKSISKFNKN